MYAEEYPRNYIINFTPSEGAEPQFVDEFDNLRDAIKAAYSLAWDNQESDCLVVVVDDNYDVEWSNEGDWRG